MNPLSYSVRQGRTTMPTPGDEEAHLTLTDNRDAMYIVTRKHTRYLMCILLCLFRSLEIRKMAVPVEVVSPPAPSAPTDRGTEEENNEEEGAAAVQGTDGHLSGRDGVNGGNDRVDVGPPMTDHTPTGLTSSSESAGSEPGSPLPSAAPNPSSDQGESLLGWIRDSLAPGSDMFAGDAAEAGAAGPQNTQQDELVWDLAVEERYCERGGGIIKDHHVESGMDVWFNMSMTADLHPANRLVYKHEFAGLFNDVSQVHPVRVYLPPHPLARAVNMPSQKCLGHVLPPPRVPEAGTAHRRHGQDPILAPSQPPVPA